jgi:hypothetical protein
MRSVYAEQSSANPDQKGQNSMSDYEFGDCNESQPCRGDEIDSDFDSFDDDLGLEDDLDPD